MRSRRSTISTGRLLTRLVAFAPCPKRPDRRRLIAIRDRLRREYGRPRAAPAPPARGRARAHRALAEHERPQPRRGLRPPARALPVLGGRAARRPWRRSRTPSGPAGSRRPRRSGSCASSRPSRRTTGRWATTPWPGWRTPRSRRRASTSASFPGSAARRPPACCSSRSAATTCPWTPTCSGWAPGSACSGRGASLEEAHDEMLRLCPEGDAYEVHVLLIRHGRRTCAARAPRCGECPLRRMCPEGRRRLASGASVDLQEVHDEDERLVGTDRALSPAGRRPARAGSPACAGRPRACPGSPGPSPGSRHRCRAGTGRAARRGPTTRRTARRSRTRFPRTASSRCRRSSPPGPCP